MSNLSSALSPSASSSNPLFPSIPLPTSPPAPSSRLPSSGKAKPQPKNRVGKAYVKELERERVLESGKIEPPQPIAEEHWSSGVLLIHSVFPVNIGGEEISFSEVDEALATVTRRMRCLVYRKKNRKNRLGTIRTAAAEQASVGTRRRKDQRSCVVEPYRPGLPASGTDIALTPANWRSVGELFTEKRDIWVDRIDGKTALTEGQKVKVKAWITLCLVIGGVRSMTIQDVMVVGTMVGSGDYFGRDSAKYVRKLARNALMRKSPAKKAVVEEEEKEGEEEEDEEETEEG